MMDPNIKQLWVTALRSGNYSQGGTGYLRDKLDNYDPLGVLGDILVRQGRAKWYASRGAANYSLISFERGDEEKGWAKSIDTKLSAAIGLKKQSDIMRLHDHGYSFKEIADFVEGEL